MKKFKPLGANYDLAKELGLNAAIIFHHISYHVVNNKETCRNIIDGIPWTTTSMKQINERFPFFSFREIRTAIDKITKAGLIRAGNFNSKYRLNAKSYTLTEKGEGYSFTIDDGCVASDNNVVSSDNEVLSAVTTDVVSSDNTVLSAVTTPIIGVNKGMKIGKKISSAQKRGRTAPKTTLKEVKIETVPVTSLTTLLDPEPDQNAKDIAECIHLFAPFNPNINKLYGNKTQRKAAAELLEKYGLQWMRERMMEIITAWRDHESFVPKVHNPWLFLSKLPDIQDWSMRREIKKIEEEKKTKSRQIEVTRAPW